MADESKYIKLSSLIEQLMERGELNTQYTAVWQKAQELGISFYEANLLITAGLNRERRELTNQGGVIAHAVDSSAVVDTDLPEDQTKNYISKEEVKEDNATEEYNKTINMQKKILVGIVTFFVALLGFINDALGIRSLYNDHFNKENRLCISDLHEMAVDFKENKQVYRLYYFDISLSTQTLDHNLTEFTKMMDQDPDYGSWLTYSKDLEANAKLQALLLADPIKRSCELVDEYRVSFFANETTTVSGSSVTEPMTRKNVEACFKRIQSRNLSNKQNDQTIFSNLFTDILYQVGEIQSSQRRDEADKRKKHVIINIISDFYSDDIFLPENKHIDDLNDVSRLTNSIMRLEDMQGNNLAIEFNLIQVKSSSAQNRYTDYKLDEKFFGLIESSFDLFHIYNINDIINELIGVDEGKEDIKNMFLSINAPTINTSIYADGEYRKRLLVMKDEQSTNAFIHMLDRRKSDNHRYYSICSEPEEEIKSDYYKTILRLHSKNTPNTATGININVYEDIRLSVGSMAGISLVPLHDLKFKSVIPQNHPDNLTLFMYHKGLDKKFMIPLLIK